MLLTRLAIAPPLLAWGYRIATTPVAELGELAEPIDSLIIKTAAEIAAEQAEELKWDH